MIGQIIKFRTNNVTCKPEMRIKCAKQTCFNWRNEMSYTNG